MKKWLKWILLAGVLAALLCVTAFAADAPTKSGIYDLNLNSGYTLEVTDISAETVTIDGSNYSFYPDAVKLTLKSTADMSGYKLVMAQSTDAMPTADNLVYIDQSESTEGKVNFLIYPKQLASGTYYIYLSTSGSAREQIATFKYYQSYKLGDVDANGKITVGDAGYVLRQVVGDTTLKLSASQLLAADVDGNGKITVGDAGYILRFIVGEMIPYPITK